MACVHSIFVQGRGAHNGTTDERAAGEEADAQRHLLAQDRVSAEEHARKGAAVDEDDTATGQAGYN